MDEIIKTCLHCDMPMQSSRSTKKYCSDACKQAAFYSRASQPRTFGVTINDKAETVNENDELPDVLAAGEDDAEEGEKAGAISIAERLPFTIADKEEQLPQLERQRYCIPITSGKAIVATSLSEDQEEQSLPLNVIKRQSFSQNKTLNGKHEAKQTKMVKQAIHAHREDEEEQYEWVRSELLDEVGDYCNDNYKTTEMFQYPKKYWYSTDLEKVTWVSERYRNIIENVLHMDRKFVDRKVIRQLNEALKAMIASFNFRYLPYNYPLKIEIINLQKTLQQVLAQAAKTIRFTLVRQTRVKLMAIRFQLADLVSGKRFHQLNFSK